jgi:hypothetical protein
MARRLVADPHEQAYGNEEAPQMGYRLGQRAL